MMGSSAATVFGMILCLGMASQGASGPQPPCGGAPIPAYPGLDSPPLVKVWESADWIPPACTGWAPSEGATLVVTVARFRHNSGMAGLRRRIGAVSQLAGLQYWSRSNQRWQALIADAHALSGPAGDRRPDFSRDEIAEGVSLYMQQEDTTVGKATYHLRILRMSTNRLVFTTENSSAIRYLGIPVFQPGAIEAIYFLEAEANEVWRYYSVARTGKQAGLLAAGREASLINRAVASFRYLAGIPSNQEPPAAR